VRSAALFAVEGLLANEPQDESRILNSVPGNLRVGNIVPNLGFREHFLHAHRSAIDAIDDLDSCKPKVE